MLGHNLSVGMVGAFTRSSLPQHIAKQGSAKDEVKLWLRHEGNITRKHTNTDYIHDTQTRKHGLHTCMQESLGYPGTLDSGVPRPPPHARHFRFYRYPTKRYPPPPPRAKMHVILGYIGSLEGDAPSPPPIQSSLDVPQHLK